MLSSILSKFYPELTNMLNDQRKKTVPLLLSQNDTSAFDFFTPVYIAVYGCYFYVAKIPNYVGGKPTNVELIKIY